MHIFTRIINNEINNIFKNIKRKYKHFLKTLFLLSFPLWSSLGNKFWTSVLDGRKEMSTSFDFWHKQCKFSWVNSHTQSLESPIIPCRQECLTLRLTAFLLVWIIWYWSPEINKAKWKHVKPPHTQTHSHR